MYLPITKLLIYFLTEGALHEFIPNRLYSGQKPIKAVNSGTKPISPNQFLKYTPAPIMPKPSITLIILSVLPTLLFISFCFLYVTQT